MGDAEKESSKAYLTYKEQARYFCYNVCGVIMDELHENVPRPVRYLSRTTSFVPDEVFHVAKAATIFAMLHKKKTMSTICKYRQTFLESHEELEGYLRNMSESYFQSINALGEEHFCLGILTYCGIISLIADYFYNGQPDCEEHGDVCRHVFSDYMEKNFKERYCLNEWDDIIKASMPWSRLYDTKKVIVCEKTDNPK